MRKYKIDENFFENIDSEEKAYFLGFLYADGSINQRTYHVDLTLNKKDIEILEKFRKLLYPNNDKPLYRIREKYLRLLISSKKLVNDLVNLGCVQKKTFKLKFPNIDINLHKHFIRGYFDGDGCVYLNNNTLNISIVGTIKLLKTIEICFIENCNVNIGKLDNRHPERDNNIRALRYGGNILINRIYHYLYDDAIIYLSRKKDIFYNVLIKKDYFCDKTKYRELKKHTITYDGLIYNQSQLSKKLSEVTKIKSSTIRKKLQNGWTIEEIILTPHNKRRKK